METKEILKTIRESHALSQEEMAQKLLLTRQAVSRWETGETIPNTDTLKLISREFNVSINTLLGTSVHLVCQCCGMPLDDASTSKEPDGYFNEDYCKWCYKDGQLVYNSLDDLLAFLVPHMANIHHRDKAEVQEMLERQLPQLKLWKDQA